MSEYVIETEGLTRCFGEKTVVRDLNLRVSEGEVFALLGRNGSGKTTTIRMLLGLLSPTRGRALVLGSDSLDLPPGVRARIGYLAERLRLYDWMRIRQIERFQAATFPKWNREIFHTVGRHFSLKESAGVGTLSRGERLGLCLALTLAAEPELLILDDPAQGLDPVAHRALLEAIVYVTGEEKKTVFLSSHSPADVERVADRIGILDGGVLRAVSPADTFRERVGRWILKFQDPPPQAPDVPGTVKVEFRPENELVVTVADPGPETEALLARLGPVELRRITLTLEEVIVSYLGGEPLGTSLIDSEAPY